jgi:hypothetical protein
VVVIVFIQAKDLLEFLATIVAQIIVHGHGEPPGLERVAWVEEDNVKIVVLFRDGGGKFSAS